MLQELDAAFAKEVIAINQLFRNLAQKLMTRLFDLLHFAGLVGISERHFANRSSFRT